jgi:response regulator RpfG family c-di-GMP phosphodiesterase
VDVDPIAVRISEPKPLRVLIAERHRTVAQSLTALVGALGGAEVTAVATGPEEAIEAGSRLAPDVAIVDLDMSPNCSLVIGLHAISPETRIIVLGSRAGDPGDLVKALASGAVGAIYQEASVDALQRALRTSTRDAPVVADEAAGVLLSSYMDVLTQKRKKDVATIEALAAAVEVRDVSTARHLERVTDLAAECLTKIDPELGAMEEMAYGFMLHDVGKIGIPDAILNKPAALDDDEWAIMRGHPEMGVRIVDPVGFSDITTDIILSHHEHWDGNGYPNRLKGEEIPIAARAFSVADAYDAMTSDRPYRAAMPKTIALDELKQGAGGTFDPDIVDLFVGLRN